MIDNIEKKIDEIIPPNDYIHRNGFSNHDKIDHLTLDEKILIEDRLINLLKSQYIPDSLVIETLAYMNSKKSLILLYELLGKGYEPLLKIILVNSIFKIDSNIEMIDIAIASFKQINNICEQIISFSYLDQFNNSKTENVIRQFVNNSNILLSNNAKRILDMRK